MLMQYDAVKIQKCNSSSKTMQTCMCNHAGAGASAKDLPKQGGKMREAPKSLHAITYAIGIHHSVHHHVLFGSSTTNVSTKCTANRKLDPILVVDAVSFSGMLFIEP